MRKMVHGSLPSPLHRFPWGYVTKNDQNSNGFPLVVKISRRTDANIQKASVLRDPLSLETANGFSVLNKAIDLGKRDLLFRFRHERYSFTQELLFGPSEQSGERIADMFYVSVQVVNDDSVRRGVYCIQDALEKLLSLPRFRLSPF